MPEIKSACCLGCRGESIEFNGAFGFYRCPACGMAWGYAEDDPDLVEAADYGEVLEQVYEVDPAYWAKMQEGQ